MKKLFLSLFLFGTMMSFAQVGIGTTTPSAAAMLDINSGVSGNYRGLLPPRVPLTSDQVAIMPTASDVGLMVFVEETGCLDFWNGTAWESIYCTGGPADIWINELHYDESNNPEDEFVELAGVAGTDVSGYYIVLYNGVSFVPYGTVVTFSGFIPDEENGYGTLAVDVPNLRNGTGGLALVAQDGSLVQFLSYEGSFTGSGGPANNITSEDIGVQEDNTTTATQSLHLTGTGNTYTDFIWQVSASGDSSQGAKNNGQIFN